LTKREAAAFAKWSMGALPYKVSLQQYFSDVMRGLQRSPEIWCFSSSHSSVPDS